MKTPRQGARQLSIAAVPGIAPGFPTPEPVSPLRWLKVRPLIAVALLASLGLLLAHAWAYRFLTDDAFISFRYARNLSRGFGLVFNPGMERVEGYTNFFWVLVLAGFQCFGLVPEAASQALSFGATLMLWGLVVREALRRGSEPGREWLVLVPAACLAITRSVAVWSSSGLETRWFEMLLAGGALRLVLEVEGQVDGKPRRPLSGWLFALAVWTRPDGLLMAASAFATAGAYLAAKRRFDPRSFAAQLLPFVILVAAQFAWRRLYYHEWLPNTYYVKVGGRTWWSSGGRYLGAFSLEYAAYLWLPLLWFGVSQRIKEGRGFDPLLYGALILPHALYVAAIGGDHFEYRPLDAYFPFLFLLIYDGARGLARGRWAAGAVAGYLGMVLLGLWELPYRSHRESPDYYAAGFPGGAMSTLDGQRFLSPDRDPIYRLPGLRKIAEAHRELVQALTNGFVAVRQEEHRHFFASVRPVGLKLRGLIEDGRLPRDVYIAMPCVGAIPYYSDVRTLDRIGLTDAHVAHSPFTQKRFMAHDKTATEDYARRRGVDLWVEVRPVCDVTSADFLMPLRETLSGSPPYYAADLGGDYLVGRFPLGFERAARRFPRLRFDRMDDSLFLDRFATQSIAAYRRRIDAEPQDDDARMQLALLLSAREDFAAALGLYQRVSVTRPNDIEVWLKLSWCHAHLGNHAALIASLERALDLARAGHDPRRVGEILGRLEQARRAERQARASRPRVTSLPPPD